MNKITVLLFFNAINLQAMHLKVCPTHLQQKNVKRFSVPDSQLSIQRNFSDRFDVRKNCAKPLSQFTNKSADSRVPLRFENRYSLLKNNITHVPFESERKFWGLVAAANLLSDDKDDGKPKKKPIEIQRHICNCCKKAKVRHAELTENYERHNAKLETEIEKLAKENWRLNVILKSVKENRDEKIFLVNKLQVELEELRAKIECNKKNENDINGSDTDKSKSKLRYLSCEPRRFIGV